MTLFDQSGLLSLIAEFRSSMRGLLVDLCDDLERYRPLVRRLRLPVELFRSIGSHVEREAYSHWKFVGWIDQLNDLLYFVDLHHQLTRERDVAGFAEQLQAECEDRFYENSYVDLLFPNGIIAHQSLQGRLLSLCRRLSHDIVQQAILFLPRLTCEWVAKTPARRWSAVCDLNANFDRAEPAQCVVPGLSGDFYRAPSRIRSILSSAENRARFLVHANGFNLMVARRSIPLYSCKEDRWHWELHAPTVLVRSSLGTLTLGPTLEYAPNRTPRHVRPTPPALVQRVRHAWAVLQEAWPEGAQLFMTLTSRIIPLRARGVVSFSYRHQPGLSFINCFDRDDLDLIDDLIHENGHHHLNLLLRKFRLYRDDGNQEIFYSPWRRSLRPLRGILHASFTFTMGALLFERLSTWGSRPDGSRAWRRSGMAPRDLLRARFRCAEELESVRYALRDLHRADRQMGWIALAGRDLIAQLSRILSRVARRIALHRPSVDRSRYGGALRRHQQELRRARERYGS